MFTQLLSEEKLKGGLEAVDIDVSELAKVTDGYTGSDISLVCREAAMRPLRIIFDKLDTMDEVKTDDILKYSPITQKDILEAISTTKSSCDEKMRGKYQHWQKCFGSV
jgi:katanin p60 ATPase-containing subunit A1